MTSPDSPARHAATTAEEIQRASQVRQRLTSEIAKVYIGDSTTTELLMVALLARGHVLLEGVPGIAKTTLIKTVLGLLKPQGGAVFAILLIVTFVLPIDRNADGPVNVWDRFGLISALEKLQEDTTVTHSASTATAHLWIEQPMSGVGDAGKLEGVHKMFDTHPPLEERIALAAGDQLESMAVSPLKCFRPPAPRQTKIVNGLCGR